ncbi:MAG: hypothetical protein KJ712_11360, partial [Bacteroidetes bacterium]|nr:hypothetical protein [Bacteroidota bacterium]
AWPAIGPESLVRKRQKKRYVLIWYFAKEGRFKDKRRCDFRYSKDTQPSHPYLGINIAPCFT